MISNQSTPHRLFSEVLSPQIAPLSCLLLPKLSTLVDCCLGLVVQHLQAFCMLLATHCHHINVVPLSLSNLHCSIDVLKSPPPSSLTSLPLAAEAASLPAPLPSPWPSLLTSPPTLLLLLLSTLLHQRLLPQRCLVIVFVVMLLGGKLEELDKIKPQRHCPWHVEGGMVQAGWFNNS